LKAAGGSVAPGKKVNIWSQPRVSIVLESREVTWTAYFPVASVVTCVKAAAVVDSIFRSCGVSKELMSVVTPRFA
jgi:hypothetical protein